MQYYPLYLRVKCGIIIEIIRIERRAADEYTFSHILRTFWQR